MRGPTSATSMPVSVALACTGMRVTKTRSVPERSTAFTIPGSNTSTITCANQPVTAPCHAALAYQAAKQIGIHRKIRRTKRGSVSGRMGRGVRCAGGQRAYPHQPYDHHVQHDQRLPEIEMRPFERPRVPLPQVE